jgi:hypothetical protein
MLAGIRKVALDSSHNQHRRAYPQVQGELPHLLSPSIHLGTLCRPKWHVGRSTPPQVGSPELSPVTILRGRRHKSVHLVAPVRVVPVECAGKPRSATAVVFQLASGEVQGRSTILTRSAPRGCWCGLWSHRSVSVGRLRPGTTSISPFSSNSSKLLKLGKFITIQIKSEKYK